MHAFPVAGMPGWFLYYNIYLMMQSAVLSASRSLILLMNLKIINNIWENVQNLCYFISPIVISLLSTNVIFSQGTFLSDKNGFIVPKHLIIVIFFRNVLEVFQLDCILFLFLFFFCLVLPSDKSEVILLKRLGRGKKSPTWIFIFLNILNRYFPCKYSGRRNPSDIKVFKISYISKWIS